MNLTTTFNHWFFNDFQNSHLWHDMENITEGSPWHCEKSVATHTNMVVAEYIAENEITTITLPGAIACAFHDAGKPAAMVLTESDEKGTYYAFHGHEKISARLWEGYAVINWDFLQKTFGLKPIDIYRIGWLIENHLPYGIKQHEKVRQLLLTSRQLSYWWDSLTSVLVADAKGRICDDSEGKLQKVDVWCKEFKSKNLSDEDLMSIRNASATMDNSVAYKAPAIFQSQLVVPIAPSGAGKSTLFKKATINPNVAFESFSMDALRLEWYSDDYAEAFRLSCDDKDFHKKVNASYMESIKTNKSIFLDNINVTKKRRAFFVNEARSHGYHIIAVLLPVSLVELYSRQIDRDNKTATLEAVCRQYHSLQLPNLGEFDEIRVLDTNL